MHFYQFSILDIIPYFLVLVLLLIFDGNKDSSKKKELNCFLVLFVLAAIRYGVGYDYYGYLDLIINDAEDYKYERIEPLSNLLIDIGKYLHYQLFFAIGSFLTLYPVYKICKKYSKRPTLSLIIFYLFPIFYFNYLSIVRNAIAISFVFYAFTVLQEKKVLNSLFYIVIACLFHKAAAIGFLIYPLCYVSGNKFVHFAIYVASFVLSIAAAKFISDYADMFSLISKGEHYMNDKHATDGGSMTIIINVLAISNLLLWSKISKLGKKYSQYLSMCNIGACLWNIFLPIDSNMANRFCVTFMGPIILLVPAYELGVSIRYRILVRHLIYSFFLLLFISYFYINVDGFIKKGGRMSDIPYQTIFFHIDYYNLQ